MLTGYPLATTRAESPAELLARAQALLADDDSAAGKRAFFALVEQAAALGDAESMMELACCYQHGTGVKCQPKLAFQWMQKAAEAGSTGAKLNMIYFHEMGIGTKKDMAKASEWQSRLKSENKG